MENPIKMDDFVVFPYFWVDTHICQGGDFLAVFPTPSSDTYEGLPPVKHFGHASGHVGRFIRR